MQTGMAGSAGGRETGTDANRGTRSGERAVPPRRPLPAPGRRRPGAGLLVLLLLLLLPARPLPAADEDLPLIKGERAVATVDGDPITLREFNEALAEAHRTHLPGEKAGRVDYSGIMQRLVNTRLIVFEAKNMGLDEMPEFRAMMEDYAKQTLMEILLERHVQPVREDEQEVDRLYREKTRAWKMESFRFQKEDDVQEAERQIKAGGDFDAVMKRAVAAGQAEGEAGGEVVKDRDLTLPVAELVSGMERGEISPIISLGKNGFLLFKLLEVIQPEEEDAELREEARREARDRVRMEAAKAYVGTLKDKLARVDRALLEGLDFEAEEPGFDRLRQDPRVLAEIDGEEPIRVQDLAKALEDRFYHGIAHALAEKKVNRKKMEVFEGMLQRRILHREALLQGLDRDETYRARVEGHERASLFGAFVQKVVVPDIGMEESELKNHYRKNKEAFSTPKMLRIKQIVFAQKRDALAALRKLNAGTDFNWLLSHAEGQVGRDEPGLLFFDGTLLSLRTMPEDLQKTMSDAEVGDARLYESPAGHFYVLYVYHVQAPATQPYEQVREQVAEAVFREKVNRTIEEWADKLRKYYRVKIFAKNLKG